MTEQLRHLFHTDTLVDAILRETMAQHMRGQIPDPGLLAIAFWLLAVRHSSRLLLAWVALPLMVALSVRLNSLPLLLPFLALLVIAPCGRAMRGGIAPVLRTLR